MSVVAKRKGPPPKFDHELARVMRSEGGFTWAALAREFGVSITAVQRVCDPKVAARLKRNHDRFQRSGTCIDCGGPRSYNPSADKTRIAQGIPPLQRCRECFAIHTSITRTKSARSETLRCSRCGEWKPDEAFQFKASGTIGRRLRGPHCSPCARDVRREYRQRLMLLEPEKYAEQVERHRLRRLARREDAARDSEATS